MMRAVFCALIMLAAAASANPVVVRDYPWANALYGNDIFLNDRLPGETTPLRLRSEDLYISPEQVRVRYMIANDTANAIKETIAFPLPTIDTAQYWFDPSDSKNKFQRGTIGRHTDDPLNFIGFRAKADGEPIAVRGRQRAFVWRRSEATGKVEDVDVTDELKAAGLPLLLLHNTDVINRLPETVLKKLHDGHVISSYDGKTGEIRTAATHSFVYHPVWRVFTLFTWRQTFPAGKTVAIDIAYQPMTGGTLRPVRWNEFHKISDPECFSEWNSRDLRRRGTFTARGFGFVLTTAEYWHGPIGHFHLTIDKLKKKSLLSVCTDGRLKKTGPTTYEFTRENYTPARNVTATVIE